MSSRCTLFGAPMGRGVSGSWCDVPPRGAGPVRPPHRRRRVFGCVVPRRNAGTDTVSAASFQEAAPTVDGSLRAQYTWVLSAKRVRVVLRLPLVPLVAAEEVQDAGDVRCFEESIAVEEQRNLTQRHATVGVHDYLSF